MRILTHSLALSLIVPATLAAQDTTRTATPPLPAPPPWVTHATFDVGYVQTSGNTQVTTTNIGEKLTRERGRFLITQTFAFVYGEQRDTVNANNLRTTLRGDYKIDKRFAFFVGAGFDRNTFAGIEKRWEEIIGLAMIAYAGTRDTLRVEAGGNMIQQLAVGGGQQNFPAARGAGSWRHVFTPLTYFQQNVEFIPNLEENDDWRLNTESAVVAPLSARIGLKLSYVIRFDNLPQPGFTDTDKIFTSGIQVTFD